jgi:hypothetical protein
MGCISRDQIADALTNNPANAPPRTKAASSKPAYKPAGSTMPARSTTWCACETWRPQFRWCKSGAGVRPVRPGSGENVAHTPGINLIATPTIEKTDRRHRFHQFFSSLLMLRG